MLEQIKEKAKEMEWKEFYEKFRRYFRTPQYGKMTILAVAGTLIIFAATNQLFPAINVFFKWLIYSAWVIFILFLGRPTGKPEEAVRLIVRSLIRVMENGYEPQEMLYQLENIIKMAVMEWSIINDKEIEKYCKEKLRDINNHRNNNKVNEVKKNGI